jgi:hypothetical protein
VKLPDKLVDYAAGAPCEPGWALNELEADRDHPLRSVLQIAIESVTDDELDEYITGPKGRLWFSRPLDAASDRRARLDLVKIRATRAVHEHKVAALRLSCLEGRPKPYNHDAVRELEVDKHSLVGAQYFDNRRGWLERGGYAFYLSPTLPAPNSSYWLTRQLLSQPASAGLRVRLDPYVAVPIALHRPVFYGMITYGRPLDWDRLTSLRETEHGKWMPDYPNMACGIACTEYCWVPRSDGIHFQCEELPLNATIRPARYLHAIYDPGSLQFIHADGAMRFYTPEELADRLEHHVRNAGKSGERVKVFSFDNAVGREAWCDIAAAFFVWNDDVQSYFRHESDGS